MENIETTLHTTQDELILYATQVGNTLSFQLRWPRKELRPLSHETRRDPQEFLSLCTKELDLLQELRSSNTDSKQSNEAQRALVSIGHRLAETLPDPIKKYLWHFYQERREFRGNAPTLQIISDIPSLPWEAIYIPNPRQPNSNGVFLGESYAVTHWKLWEDIATAREPARTLPLRKIGLLQAQTPELQETARESRFLHSLTRDKSRTVLNLPSAKEDFLRAIETELLDGLHITGHGDFLSRSTNPARLFLDHHGQSISGTELMTSAFPLTEPLVLLNACFTASQSYSATTLSGFPTELIKAGAGAVIGTRWSVYDAAASTFALKFYDLFILQGVPLGEAVRQARLHLRRLFPGTSDWLAYTAFGHPTATTSPFNVLPEPPNDQGARLLHDQLLSYPADVPARPKLLQKLLEAIRSSGSDLFWITGDEKVGKSKLLEQIYQALISGGEESHLITCSNLKQPSEILKRVGQVASVVRDQELSEHQAQDQVQVPKQELTKRLIILDDIRPDIAASASFEHTIASILTIPAQVLVSSRTLPVELDCCKLAHYEIAPLSLEQSRRFFYQLLSMREMEIRRFPPLDCVLTDLGGKPDAIETTTHLLYQGYSIEKIKEAVTRFSPAVTTNLPAALTQHVANESPASTSVSEELLRLVRLLHLLPDGLRQDTLTSLLPENPQDLIASALWCGFVEISTEHKWHRIVLRENYRADLGWVKQPKATDLRNLQEYYCNLSVELGGQIGFLGGRDAAIELSAEIQNIEKVLFSTPLISRDRIVQSLLGVAQLTIFTELGDFCIELLESAATEDLEPGLRARCKFALAHISLRRDQHSKAKVLLLEARELYESAANSAGVLWCSTFLAELAIQQSYFQDAIRHSSDALRHARELHSRTREADCLKLLSDVHLRQGDFHLARSFCLKALAKFGELNMSREIANCLQSLAHIEIRQDHVGSNARRWLERALETYQEIGSVLGVANCLLSLGKINILEGKPVEAKNLLYSALEAFDKAQNQIGRALCLKEVGSLLALHEDTLAEGLSRLHEAQRICEELDERYHLTRIKAVITELEKALEEDN